MEIDKLTPADGPRDPNQSPNRFKGHLVFFLIKSHSSFIYFIFIQPTCSRSAAAAARIDNFEERQRCVNTSGVERA